MQVKRRLAGGVLLSGLLLGLGAAQGDVSIYGGQFLAGQNVGVEVYAPAGTVFRLERVNDPYTLLTRSGNPRRPALPAAGQTRLVGTYRASGERLNLGRLPSGVYLVRSGGNAGVLVVSRLGLLVKRDSERAVVYAADRQSGQTRDAVVWAVGQSGAQRTGNGLAGFAKSLKEGQVFLARSGNDWAVSGSDWNEYNAPDMLGYIYTDRPVYRPGHRVELKGVVRQPGTLKPLAGKKLMLLVTDPDDQEVLRREVTANAYGSVTASLDLKLTGRLGSYRAVLLEPGQEDEGHGGVSGSFRVEEYQKPEYAVTVSPERGNAVQGEKVSVKVGARYLFGGVPGGAKVTYNVTRARYYPPGFDMESLPPGEDEGPDYGSDLAVQGSARLDAAGEFVLSVPLAKDEQGNPVRYRVEAEVEDESRRPVSAQTQIIAYPAAVNVETQTGAYIYEAGKPMTLSVDTRDLKEQGTAAPVTLELVRQEWVRHGKDWKEKETVLSRRQVTTSRAGKAQVTLNAPRGGGYVIRSTVRDAQGRLSRSENWVWVVSDTSDWSWWSRDMNLTLDKREYQAGDTATVLVTNPSPGSPVLLTLEGERLRRTVVLRGAGSVLTYRFTVTPDMTPNIFVAAGSFSGGERYAAEARLRVPRPEMNLTVNVTTDKQRYQPGQPGTFRVQVRDAKGQGVPAELSLGVVDEAIYLIQRDSAPSLTKVFGAERDNQVGTQSSQDFYFEQVRARDAAAPPAAPMTRAAFAQSKAGQDAAQSDETPRELFKDTLVWVPNLVTDERGQAELKVTFPDNLTTWIATARAQGKEPRFGQATASALVTKDVIARLSLPPFLVRGDRAVLGGIVNNTLTKSVTGTAKVALQGLSPLGGAALGASGAPLNLAASGRSRQDFSVLAPQVGQASLTFGAKTTLGSDALKLPLNVLPRGYNETVNVVGSAAQPQVSFTLPAATNAQTVTLNVSATPSLLSAVTPALSYLLGYPYGCTEQTMSRFLPALLARSVLGSGDIPETHAAKLDEYAELGLARLAKFQHEDGGWNFWEYDDSTLEMTAYVTEGLLRAKAVGLKVDNGMLSRALTYLKRTVKKTGERQAERARAYRVLAQAGQVNLNELTAFAARKDLTPYSLAQTALALKSAGQGKAALNTLERLKARAVRQSGLTHWEGSTDGSWLYYWDDNSNQVTAAALEALARLEPGSDLIPGTSQWLLRQRRGPAWLSTQDTASVVIAALSLPRQGQPAQALPVLLDGQQVGQLAVQGRSASLDLNIPLGAGPHTLSVPGAAAGTSYAAEIAYAREPGSLNARQEGVTVNRKYEKLTARWNEKDQRYTYARLPLLQGGKLSDVKVGDLILVTLNVKPKNEFARYLLVSDPIPAGTKALDDRSLAIAGLPERDEYDWDTWDDWYSGRDLRDDRVDLYAAYLEGTGTMTYLLRVQTPGTFTALPTHAFLMYDPDVQGYGPAATLNVKP